MDWFNSKLPKDKRRLKSRGDRDIYMRDISANYISLNIGNP